MSKKTEDTGEGLTHLDERGGARMVDVSSKAATQRVAVAEATVVMSPATLRRIRSGELPKGEVFPVARVAAIQAAKRAGELIPLCHTLPVEAIEICFLFPDEQRVRIRATVKVTAKTGVEMEALTAVSVGALAVYDMCKAVDRSMRIEAVELVSKRGGRSGDFQRENG